MSEQNPPARTDPQIEVAAFVRDPDTQAFLDGYLRDAAGGAFVAQRGGVDEAIAFLESAPRPPRLLIVDLSGYETPLSEIDRLAEACEPSIVVLAIGENNAVHLFRELMRAGVADYVTKPLIPELLEPYVRERKGGIAELGRSVRRGKVVCFAGSRGGAGATTLAVGCALRLANVQQRRVALLDLDIHSGSSTVQLGAPSAGLVEALENHEALDAVYVERLAVKVGERLSVFADEAPINAPVRIETEALDALLAALSEEYHYVLVDMPPVLGPLHSHMLAAARARVVIADRSLPGMRDAARLLDEASSSLSPSLLVINDHHPGLEALLDDAMIEEALSRRPDIEIGYDRRATMRVDNLGEKLTEMKGPLAVGVEEIVGWLSGQRTVKRSRSLLRLISGGRR